MKTIIESTVIFSCIIYFSITLPGMAIKIYRDYTKPAESQTWYDIGDGNGKSFSIKSGDYCENATVCIDSNRNVYWRKMI